MTPGIRMFPVISHGIKNHVLRNRASRLLVPWPMMNERRAQMNHSQSLERLAERGGLDLSEIWSNLIDTRLSFKSRDNQDNQALCERIEAAVQAAGYDV